MPNPAEKQIMAQLANGTFSTRRQNQLKHILTEHKNKKKSQKFASDKEKIDLLKASWICLRGNQLVLEVPP